MAFTTVTVKGTFTRDGAPNTGFVVFRLTDRMQNGTEVVEPEDITGPLDADGYMEVRLKATDDFGTLPQPSTYRILIRLTGEPVRSYTVEIPSQTAQVLDINDLISSVKIGSIYADALQLLRMLKTVDGHDSGLDADTVDGYHASSLAHLNPSGKVIEDPASKGLAGGVASLDVQSHVPLAQLAGITSDQIDTAFVDGLAGVPSMRSLGPGPQQAAAGTDSRIVGAEQVSHKNQASGYAGLDTTTHIPVVLLPEIDGGGA